MANQTWRRNSMKEIITALEAKTYECEGAYYPYENGRFTVELKKGKNEVEFADEAHYNRFIQKATNDLMDGIIYFGVETESEEVSAESETKAAKGKKK